MKLKPHQIKASEEAKKVLEAYKLCYIFGPPRVGKSLTALKTMETYGRILVLTRKNAIEGWNQYLDLFKNYTVTNYEKIAKLNSKDFDAVIIDEAHNFGSRPKASLRVKLTKIFCKDKPILYLSGTPLTETPLGIYHQFYLSSFNPLKMYRNFYEFFRFWGVPDLTYISGRQIESYSKARPELLSHLEDYIVRVSYEDAGFNYQNYDKVVQVIPEEAWVRQYKNIQATSFLGDLPLETASSVYQALHQFEGGIYKDGRKFSVKPKIDWLVKFCKENKGKKIAVMSYFKAEQDYLRSLSLPGVEVFSSTKYCEGIDLSHFDIYVLYSFGYSGAKFVQLRDRIVNINKNKKTYVLIPVVSGGLCEKVYACVKDKHDFNASVYRSFRSI